MGEEKTRISERVEMLVNDRQKTLSPLRFSTLTSAAVVKGWSMDNADGGVSSAPLLSTGLSIALLALLGLLLLAVLLAIACYVRRRLRGPSNRGRGGDKEETRHEETITTLDLTNAPSRSPWSPPEQRSSVQEERDTDSSRDSLSGLSSIGMVSSVYYICIVYYISSIQSTSTVDSTIDPTPPSQGPSTAIIIYPYVYYICPSVTPNSGTKCHARWNRLHCLVNLAVHLQISKG
jgi:hypothetical protein